VRLRSLLHRKSKKTRCRLHLIATETHQFSAIIGFPKKLTFLLPVLVRPLGLSVALRTDDRFFFFCLSRPMIVMILDTEFAYDENRPFSGPALKDVGRFRVPPTPTRTKNFMMLKFNELLALAGRQGFHSP
jgi:hypothetical protein